MIIQNKTIVSKKDSNKKKANYGKIFRYTLIKMLKSLSTYIILLILLLVNISEIATMGQSPQNGIDTFYIYSWSMYIIYFALSAMYIGFKSTQVIRDEIDDGTLLIFSSLPISRFQLIIEKWFALQLVCIMYSIIVFFLPPLILFPVYSLAHTILINAGFLFLTAIIIQLILSTIAILVSLVVGAKGVIGLTTLFGILSIVGAIIPMTYNIVESSNSSVNYLNNDANNYNDFLKKGSNFTSKSFFNDLTNINYWNIVDSQNVPASTNDGGIFIINNNIISPCYYLPIGLQTSTKTSNQIFINGNGTQTYENVSFILPSDSNNSELKGVNIFNQFLADVKTSDNSSNYSLTLSSGFPKNFDLNPNNIIFKSGLTTNQVNLDNELLNLMKKLYNQGIYLNDNISLFPDEFSSNAKPATTGYYKLVPNLDESYFAENNYIWAVDNNNPNQINVAFTLTFMTALMFNTVLGNLTLNNVSLSQYNHQVLIYKIMGYLNIWQQWLVMWNGPAKYSNNSFIENDSQNTFVPVNYYFNMEYNNNLKKLVPVGFKIHAITNVTVLYVTYLFVSLILGGLTIYAVYRKDFI